jgi:iron(III) transport system ATP-binding protein
MADLLCQGLAKSYGARRVLSDVDLAVPEGTTTAILGASGSGKTTLLRLVIGFIRPDGGTVSIEGNVVADADRIHVPADRREVGYVAQEGALFPHLSVGQNVAFGLPRGERRSTTRIGEALDLVGLGRDYADRRPHELSGGEQRRVALARALAPRPRLVLLDEPFSGLDAALRAETREAVLGALAGGGATAVLVTHDQAEALSTGREVGILRAGRLVQTAPPADLYREPADLDVARFVGDAVIVPGEASGETVDCVLGRLPLREQSLDGPVDVMIRPEQVTLAGDGNTGVGATVVEHAFFGAETLIRLVLAKDSTISLMARTLAQDIPPPGRGVSVDVLGRVRAYPRDASLE